MGGTKTNQDGFLAAGVWLLIGVAFIYGARHHFLLFHGAAELLSVGIGFGVFTIAYNTAFVRENSFVVILGIGLVFVAGIDILHTLAYKGMGVFPDGHANLPTQLWLAGRYVFVLSVYGAIWLCSRTVRRATVLLILGGLTALILFSIYWGAFPDAYLEETGLTPFKVGSEYAICLLLAASLALLHARRIYFTPAVYRLMQAAIGATIISELAFTLYVGVYDISNIVGHYFKCLAFYFIYKAVVQTTISDPYRTIFRRSKAARDDLEERVLQLGLELKMVFTHAKIGLLLLQGGRIIRECNSELLRMLGYDSQDELVGRSVRVLHVSEETFERFGEAHYDRLVQGALPHVEYQLVSRDGTPVWCQLSGTPLDSARPADLDKGVLWVIDDISDRKAAEHDLREALERVSFHVNNSPLGVIEWDEQGRVAKWSARAEEIFGWTGAEVLGKSWEDFPFIHPDDAAEVNTRIGRLISGRERYNVIENRNLRKNGSVVHCQWYNSPLRDEAGNVVSILSQVADVSGLHEAIQAARQANVTKSAFLANMSHEVRTPINGIMGMLQLMETTQLDEQQREFIHMALQSSQRLLRLLSDILDLSRVEADKLVLLAEPISLVETVNDVIQVLTPMAVEKGLKLRTKIDPETPFLIMGDAHRLQQILSNLVGNAIKFTLEGSVELVIQPLSPVRENECRILFSVADTGIGINPEDLDSLFTPFSQVEGSFQRQFQGAGLGLAITRRLVLMMDGNMSVESDEGKGSTFHISIPFPCADDRVQALSETPGAISISGRDVLLVEDDPTSAAVARMTLEQVGMGVRVARDGREALEKLRQGMFDLVLMDIQMPIMDGVEATLAIRNGKAGEANRNIPIIAMTAYAMTGDKERFLEARMDGYVSKPVETHALIKAMLRFLQSGERGL